MTEGLIRGISMYIYNSSNKDKARALRKEMTPWENKLWHKFLKNCGIRFYRQRPVGDYILDFYSSKIKLCIELDGSQHYMGDGIQYDEMRTRYLNENGITVIRFSNYDVDRNFDSVCQSIMCKIEELRTPQSAKADSSPVRGAE